MILIDIANCHGFHAGTCGFQRLEVPDARPARPHDRESNRRKFGPIRL